MNYPESQQILGEITKAKKVLVNCHKGPDPDSIGSATALSMVLEKMGKEVEIICPNSEIPGYLKFLKNFDKIKNVDFSKFDFSKFDLFIVIDSSSWDMVLGQKDAVLPTIPVVVIDHHKTNKRFGTVNLVDDKVTSAGELLFWVLKDWDVEIDKDIATSLMTGIVGDTGAFRYPGTTARTFKVAQDLMEAGVDKDEVVFHVYHSIEFGMVKFWGEIIAGAQIDEEHKFVWSTMPYKKYVELGSYRYGRESAASLIAQIIDKTDFGFVAVEQEEGRLSVSFRSRTGLDISQVASELGGGGHIYAAGAKIEGLPFDQAVEKLLATARKYARK